MKHLFIGIALASILTLWPGFLGAAPIQDAQAVEIAHDPSALFFAPLVAHGGMHLTVTGPADFVHAQDFAAGEGGALDARGLADGTYRWEIVARPDLSREQAQRIASARETGDHALVERLQSQGVLPTSPLTQSGSFTVLRGQVMDPSLTETAGTETQTATDGHRAPATGVGGLVNTSDEFYASGDLYVHNSACIGFDCPTSGLAFGSDTIWLMENNLRVHFEDTSNAPFPDTDWRILINDSTSGGLNRFSVQDVTSNRLPFTIEGRAPSNSLYVDDGGRIGVGTSAPTVDLHVKDGDSPTLRLEQDTSSGFGAQTWDVAGNETNFFIRDATNGSTLPFRIRPGAASNSIYIENDNDVGIGTASIDSDVRLQIQANTSSNFGGLRVENNGTGNIQTQFAASTWEWRQTFRSGDMIFDSQEDGANEWELDTAGNVTATSFNPTSDRNLKQGFVPVDSAQILDRLAAIPVTQWSYLNDTADTLHIGPVAQDFHAAFGVGADDRHISTTDADGVAFAAIQALYQRLQDKEAEIDTLKAQVQMLLELQRTDGATALDP